ncbi:MAG: hypothetical protein K2N24_12380 [Lachnospiraceae bacterium]|nr:hypothetical protein [Lachnospiraceae bacterium]
MLKLNSEDEKALYSDWNGSVYGRSEYVDPENGQMDCLNILEEKISLYAALDELWQEKLLRTSGILNDAVHKMKSAYGVAGVFVGFSFLIMVVVVLLKLGSEYVMLATGAILLMTTIAFVFIYFGVEATCFYGVHSEWKIFENYIKRYEVVPLKSEIDGLLQGIQYMRDERQRAEQYKERLKKGEWLSQEEYQWASTRPEAPPCPVHSENLAKNLLKKKKVKDEIG